MNSTIANAIANKNVLSFSYDGHPRVVQPHAYGVSTAGHEVIRAFQVAGSSSSGRLPAWKIMEVGRISGLQVSSTCFAAAAPGYARGDKGMSTIYAQI